MVLHLPEAQRTLKIMFGNQKNWDFNFQFSERVSSGE
jgi:hypothetical protein